MTPARRPGTASATDSRGGIHQDVAHRYFQSTRFNPSPSDLDLACDFLDLSEF